MSPSRDQLLRPTITITYRRVRSILLLIAICQLWPTALIFIDAYGQGIKGGSIGSGSSTSFLQQFSQLTPAQQQQFIRQQSSSRRVIQSQQPGASSFSEEISNSGGSGPIGGSSFSNFQNTGSSFGGKTSGFKSERIQSSVLSPVQQANFIKQSRFSSQAIQPQYISPTGSSSFIQSSKQISSQQPQIIPITNNEQTFQTMRSFLNSLTPTQLQSFISRMQTIQQQQPIVITQPSSESSFRRVQSFSSSAQQPVNIGGETSSFNQIISNQQQPQQTGFSRFQQQFSSQNAAQSIPISQQQEFFRQQQLQQSSGSPQSSFNSFTSSATNGGFDGGLSQEKIDSTSTAFDSNGQLVGGVGSFTDGTGGVGGQSSLVQQSNSNFGGTGGTSGFNSQSTGFEGSDVQQRNTINDDFSGLTAASINNKWYIMRPMDGSEALALRQTTSLGSGGQQQASSTGPLRFASVLDNGAVGETSAGISSVLAPNSITSSIGPSSSNRISGAGQSSSTTTTSASTLKKQETLKQSNKRKKKMVTTAAPVSAPADEDTSEEK